MIEYKEYLKEKLSESISYSEYVAEQLDRNISFAEYLSGMYDTKNVKRKEKIKNLFK
jgi:hypothetical protein